MWKVLKQIARTGMRSESLRSSTSPHTSGTMPTESGRIQNEILTILGKALTIRHVDAGSCNGCELELHALNNAYYNLEGYGIKFVASPRHADLLLVTGPVSRNMVIALQRTYAAMPEPRLVVAAGDCACNGGIFGESYACVGRVSAIIPVDIDIPGCPPDPVALLQGILAAVRRFDGQRHQKKHEVL